MMKKLSGGILVALVINMIFSFIFQSTIIANDGVDEVENEKLINIAMNEKAIATASSEWNDDKSASKVRDGIVSKDSRWVSKYENGVEKPEWVKIDLGDVYSIDEVRINFEAAYASEYTISSSLDDESYDVIKTVTDGKVGENIQADLESKKARYVKLDLTKQGREDKKYGFSIYEIEVYDYSKTEEIPMTAEMWAQQLESIPPIISADGSKIELPKIDSDIYEVSLFGSDNQQVVAMDGRIIQPLQDMKVNLLYKIQNKKDSTDFATTSKDVSIVIPGKYKMSENDNLRPQVIPGIREWKGYTGNFTLLDDSKIIVTDESLTETATTIQSYFKEMLGINIAIGNGVSKKEMLF